MRRMMLVAAALLAACVTPPPDLASFPRGDWIWATREACGSMANLDLDYGDPRGSAVLRGVLAGYLRRVRAAAAGPDDVPAAPAAGSRKNVGEGAAPITRPVRIAREVAALLLLASSLYWLLALLSFRGDEPLASRATAAPSGRPRGRRAPRPPP